MPRRRLCTSRAAAEQAQTPHEGAFAGRFAGRDDKGEWIRYVDYMDAQLRELLTGYGEIGGIWFDGWWDKPEADWRLGKTYKLIQDQQPAALVGNNHHRLPFPGEDFQMFEKDLPGHNTTGWNTEAERGDLPIEMCDTINNSWGYNKNDGSYKSTTQLVQMLGRSAGYDGNLQTREYTKILPDGLFTPGTHIQYFYRNENLVSGTIGFGPDTLTVSPQNSEGPNTDGHRWQQWSVLPDMWKKPAYGGLGNAPLLVVDQNDRGGNERVWVSVADSIGATSAVKRGAHNGWSGPGGVSVNTRPTSS